MTWAGGHATPPAEQRLRAAWGDQPASDYQFDFWTALGWTVLTCGLFSFYVIYQLVRRSRDHNRRRLAFLEAANAMAWDRASTAGRGDELRPRFERVAASLRELHRLEGEFRDPALWTVICLLGGGLASLVLYWLLDSDLVAHGRAEAWAEHELGGIVEALGAGPVAAVVTVPKLPHRYWLRVAATVASCGLYGLWWLYDLMVEGNDHLRRNWQWEAAMVRGLGGA